MIIGVISDSHRETKVAAGAIEWLLARGADLLVHAGDIVESETLRLLRQSGKPYFAVLGNNDEALAELKNDFNLHDEPFCTEFAGLRLKIMHHPFYLFDEEPATQNEADELNLDADLGAGADRAVNFHKNFDAGLVKNSGFSDEASCGMNLGSNCGADRREILIANSKAADRSANLDANSNGADVDKILDSALRADENFKNAHRASANLKSGQPASPNVNLSLNAGADANSNANLDLDLGSDMNSKASLSADRTANLTAPSLSANLAANINLNSNLTASLSPNASGEGKNLGPCGRDADKIPTIKIYGHTHYFAAAMDKNGALVLNPGEICGRKKRLFEFAYVVAQGGKFRVFHVCAAPEKALKWREREIKL